MDYMYQLLSKVNSGRKLVNKYMYVVILILSLWLSYLVNVQADSSDIVTFLSIIMGFQIASFSLLFTSDTVKELYNYKSSLNPRITQKHELKNYYKLSFNTSIISILLLLFIPTNFRTISRFLYLPIILLNCYMLYVTNNFLYKIFIKEVKK